MSDYVSGSRSVPSTESAGVAALAVLPLAGRVLLSAIFLLSGILEDLRARRHARLHLIGRPALRPPRDSRSRSWSNSLVAWRSSSAIAPALLPACSPCSPSRRRWPSIATSPTRTSSSTSSRTSRWLAACCRSWRTAPDVSALMHVTDRHVSPGRNERPGKTPIRGSQSKPLSGAGLQGFYYEEARARFSDPAADRFRLDGLLDALFEGFDLAASRFVSRTEFAAEACSLNLR